MHPFGQAIEARDVEAAVAVLADNVVFNSPVVFRRYVGKDAAGAVLTAVARVFEDFSYQAELTSDDGHQHALMFRARVGDKELEGCDFLHHGEDGLVDEFTVMVRPLSAAMALRDRMAAELAGSDAP